MVDIFLQSIFIGLGLFYLVTIIRKLPGIKTWTIRGVKPWACDACMSFWVTVLHIVYLIVFGFQSPNYVTVMMELGSAATCFILLSWYAALPPPPGPELPFGM